MGGLPYYIGRPNRIYRTFYFPTLTTIFYFASMSDLREFLQPLFMERPGYHTHQRDLLFITLRAFYPDCRLPATEDVDGMSPQDIIKLVTALNPEFIPKPSSVSLS